MAIPDAPDDKAKIRHDARRVLSALGPAETADWSAHLTRHLADWLAGMARLDSIASFAALPGEPDLLGLHPLLPNRNFAYPLVGPDHSLTFHRVVDPLTLVPGSFGIREPDPSSHPQVDHGAIRAVLCPGLAFGADGSRLGRGKGYYDRLLASLDADCPRIGVAFGVQVRASVPSEAHDVRMTHLVTEEGFVDLTPPAGPA